MMGVVAMQNISRVCFVGAVSKNPRFKKTLVVPATIAVEIKTITIPAEPVPRFKLLHSPSPKNNANGQVRLSAYPVDCLTTSSGHPNRSARRVAKRTALIGRNMRKMPFTCDS
jgi:hypothetical protein